MSRNGTTTGEMPAVLELTQSCTSKVVTAIDKMGYVLQDKMTPGAQFLNRKTKRFLLIIRIFAA